MKSKLFPACARPGALLWAGALGALVALEACGSRGGSGFEGVVGQELEKPGGGTYFLDAHQGGQASRVRLVGITWGRVVDVHQLDASGAVDPAPVFVDLVVHENVQSDGSNYRLETNAITQETRLIVLRHRGTPDSGSGTFESLLTTAVAGLPPILPKHDDGSSSPPFSLLARNGCLQLHFDDLLEDGMEARAVLADVVRVITGYPPSTPFATRIVFDPHHGGIASGEFHSTRVLIDMTVSEEEQSSSPVPLVVNSLGLPASLPDQSAPNVSIRIPTRLDPVAGQFSLLTNLGGSGLDPRANGPADLDSRTRDVVRALRSGRGEDGNNGFLLDLNKPELIGAWPVVIEDAGPLPGGTGGVDFLVDLTFGGPCRSALVPPAIVQSGEFFLEVAQPSEPPSPTGEVNAVHLRLVAGEAIEDPAVLRGNALYLSTYERSLLVPVGCWVDFLPQPAVPPTTGVSALSEVHVRFSEPMDPASLDPFDSFRLVRGDSNTQLIPTNLVIARTRGSMDLREFTVTSVLPFAFGSSGEYHLDLVGGPQGATDLAGNALATTLPPVDFVLDPLEPAVVNGGTALRFASTDELEPIGAHDVRGQFFFDFSRGTIRPRSVTFESFPADRTQPVPSIMIPFAPGVQTPLSALGSKLQTVWRYCDLGWQVLDETKHNLDVTGLSWSPIGGQVLSDFFDRFEVRLSHSRRLPDEFRIPTGNPWPCSGLGARQPGCPMCMSNVPFTDNILVDPLSPQKVVHDRSLGYHLNPADLFVGSSGTTFMPYPLNRSGGPLTTYTWRDTAVLALGGQDTSGIPLAIEVNAPLNLEPGPPGRIAPSGMVPSFGLPLLIEIRCFPSSSGIGLNPLDISLAQNALSIPNFRAFSTGGVNTSGVRVLVDPDLELIPSGGFNPNSRPPGQRTLLDADNSFYIGQLDTVVRISRGHTMWIDSQFPDPHYLTPVISPTPEAQPLHTQMIIEYRGAEGFTGSALTEAFDAGELDPYGDVGDGAVQFLGEDPTWKEDIRVLDGAQFVQLRFTFLNDLQSGLTPELSAVGIAYSRD